MISPRLLVLVTMTFIKILMIPRGAWRTNQGALQIIDLRLVTQGAELGVGSDPVVEERGRVGVGGEVGERIQGGERYPT